MLAPGLRAAVLEEVIVSAQKRTQSAQDVPLSITAMSGEAMREAGVFSTKDLTDVNPSISFDVGQSSQNASLKIRGIGSVGNGRTFEGAVGVFIDGVYRSRSGMALSDMNDIAGLELLRGPQGTLFGKNTVAGALSLNSTRPSLDMVEGRLEVIGGSYEKRYASAAINMPINERNAVRVSLMSNQEDGYYRSPQQNGRTFNNTDRQSAKVQWLFDVSDTLESLLIFDYSNSNTGCCWGSVQVVSGPLTDGVEYFANQRGLELYKAPDAERGRLTNNNKDSRAVIKDIGLTWKLDWALEDMDIASVTGVRYFKENQIQGDADFGPAHLVVLEEPAEIDFWSQEVNVSWVWGPTDFVAGLYYSLETFDSQRSLVADTDTNAYVSFLVANMAAPGQAAVLCELGGCANGQLAPEGGEPVSVEHYYQDAESAAVFFHTQTMLNEAWTLVAGLRYSVDEKSGGYDNIYWYNSPAAQAIVNSGATGAPPSGDASTPRNAFDVAGLYWGPSFQDSFESGVVSGTASLQYTFNDDVMAYATYSRGYKSGAVNLFFEADNFDNTVYEPEYAESLELGLKSRYLDDRGQTNISVFETHFTDLQINFFTGLNFFTENTGEATSRGMEIENQFQASESLRAELNITVLDAKFGDLADGPETVRHLDGRETARAPTLSAVGVLNYEEQLSDTFYGSLRLSASYSGEHYAGVDFATEPTQGPYTLWDLSAGLRYMGGQEWALNMFCKNCTDVTYRTIYFAAPLQEGSFNAYLNTPRIVGLSLSTYF
nr:TonB-dependent receptor [Spongiibacter thalassae]